MPEPITLLLILLLGIATGFIDSTVGSGGLISVPSLIFIGLPPQIAIGTDRFGMIGQILSALVKFSRAKKINWKYVPIFTLLGFVGAIVGANILLGIEEDRFETIIGVLLFILLPLVFFKSKIGIKKRKTAKLQKGIGLTIYLFLMIFSGFFGAGVGPIMLYTVIYFLGFTIIESIATSMIPWFVLSISSLVIFANNGLIDYQKGIFLLIGMTIGGYLGAHIALQKGDVWIKRLFAVVIIVSGIKLLFF
ncbi:MAG: sulfite exporter TauE/SafE family protein [Patescibacteria group bacterium]|nr:sulfite exporter TauE/SafE family protein [Patescibacteria group bacterium]